MINNSGYVMIRFRKSSSKIDTTLTSSTSALMKMWAMNNTTSSKETVIIDGDNGNVIFRASGKKDDFPDIEDIKYLHVEAICNCEDIGISFKTVKALLDCNEEKI